MSPRPSGRSAGRFASLAVLVALASAALFVAGCSQPTPEERYLMAVDKVQNQRPPDYLGATHLLRELIKSQELDPAIRLNSYLLLAQIYNNIREFDRAIQFLQEGRDFFGLDTEEGQSTQEALINTLSEAGMLAEALAEVQAMLERDDLPVPRQTRLRLRETGLLNETGASDEARELLAAMAREFDGELEQLTLESLITTYLPDHPTSAAQAYLRFIEEKPDSPLVGRARFGAGVLFMRGGDSERATPLINDYIEQETAAIAAIEATQEKIERLGALSRAYQLAGRHEEERAIFRSLADEYADDPRIAAGALIDLAFRYADAIMFDEAFAAFEEIQNKYPGTAYADQASDLVRQLSVAKVNYEQTVARLAEQDAADAAAAAADDAATTETLPVGPTNEAAQDDTELPTPPEETE